MFSGAPGPQAVSQGVFEIWSRTRARDRGLAEARPPFPASSARSAAAARSGGTRNRIEWWISSAARKELACDDVRVRLDVRVDQRAVVVVERAGLCVRRVCVGALEGDGLRDDAVYDQPRQIVGRIGGRQSSMPRRHSRHQREEIPWCADGAS